MARLSFQLYQDLPEAERIRRIGELIGLAILRHCARPPAIARQNRATRLAKAPPVEPWALITDEVERQMLRYLERVGAATPRDLQVALGLSSMTVTRHLSRLRAAGVLAVTGRTRAVRYQIRTEFSAN
jgi:CRP-like cAMP-binding protein